MKRRYKFSFAASFFFSGFMMKRVVQGVTRQRDRVGE